VAGEAAILINPNKVSEIKSAIKKVLENEDLRKNLSRAGIAQAKKFSWEKCAEETVRIYNSVTR
jgi:glycosyltransferase involved in cell wall biosynthesis